MPMDGFTLSFITDELKSSLLGAKVDKVNQPERDALLLTLRGNGTYKLLLSANCNQTRVQLTEHSYENPKEPPTFCMLMRKHLQGARIADIVQIHGDRLFTIVFDCRNEMNDPVTKTLWLELMGRHSNLTLTDEKGTIIDAIRHVNSEMSRVRTVLPGGHYDLPPQQDKLVWQTCTAEALQQRFNGLSCPLRKALQEHISGMASICAAEVCAQLGIDGSTPLSEIDLSFLCKKLAELYHSFQAAPVLLQDETGMITDFFPFPYLTFESSRQKPMPSISAAMDDFYIGRDLRLRMQQRSEGLERQIKNAIDRVQKKKGIMLEALNRTDEMERDRICGDLLTAYLHQLPKTASSVEVQNYYEPNLPTVTISLNPRFTTAQNAQLYYKKYRKAKQAEAYAKEQIDVINRDLSLLEGALDDLEHCQNSIDLAEVRQVLIESGFLKNNHGRTRPNKPKRLPEGKPYRFAANDGTIIEVGKNALQNDRLTLHARGGETWLHVQGMPGSHVIIRGEEKPSDETLLYAAKLAAYFSKGKNQPLLPIDYTLRKYVKKGANAVPGLVTYTGFHTLYITLTPQEITDFSNLAIENV